MISIVEVSLCLLASLCLEGSAERAASLAHPRYDVEEYSSHHDSDSPQSFYPGAPAPHGYQFSSFRGPVSGRIKEVSVPYALAPGVQGTPYSAQGGSPAMSFDYIAKPDYAYTFGVHDPESGNAQKQYEARDGDTVRGEYSFVEPDGTLRTVTYTADPVHGFQANVKYGPSGLPAPPPPTPSPSPSYTGAQGQYTGTQGQYTGTQARHKYRKPLHRLNYKKQPSFNSFEDDEY